MNNLRIFNTMEELRGYIRLNTNNSKEIGFGVEGVIYLSKDGDTIKEIQNPTRVLPYDEEIITTNDYKLDSFIFPSELYLYNNIIYGYKAKYFKNDLFCDLYRENAVEMDLEKLLAAREKMIEDIKVLTNDNYKLDDLFGNILFDGEKLVGIDTLSYYKESGITLDDNISSLDQALNFKLYKIDSKSSTWDLSLEDRVKKLIKENGTSKILVKPINI